MCNRNKVRVIEMKRNAQYWTTSQMSRFSNNERRNHTS